MRVRFFVGSTELLRENGGSALIEYVVLAAMVSAAAVAACGAVAANLNRIFITIADAL